MLYYAFNKPFGVLSQFSDEDGHPGLGRLIDLPNDVYPIGRLDRDSEGLLLLTNDNRFKHHLLQPENEHSRTYWVQVEGAIHSADIELLLQPMEINFKGKVHQCLAKSAAILDNPDIWLRVPPIRFRKEIPTSWISLELTQGKNRQVRRMTAQIGFPTLRLVRVAFGSILLSKLKPGELVQLSKHDLQNLIKY
jgi:23S rRNA pseudouridine2457 synthase